MYWNDLAACKHGISGLYLHCNSSLVHTGSNQRSALFNTWLIGNTCIEDGLKVEASPNSQTLVGIAYGTDH